MRYSETRPAFIRGLLENVGPEIDPIRLIRRIKNGLEIPGLKEALIKILQDFNLQVSLLEGCQTIMHGDCSDFARKLHKDQTSGFFLSGDIQIHSHRPTASSLVYRESAVSYLRATAGSSAAVVDITVPMSSCCSRHLRARWRHSSSGSRIIPSWSSWTVDWREDCIVGFIFNA